MKTVKGMVALVSRYRHVIGLVVVATWPLVACWAVVRFGGLTAAYQADLGVFGGAFAVAQIVVVSLVGMVCGSPVIPTITPEPRPQPKFYTAENCRWFIESGLFEKLSESDKAGLLACTDLESRSA